jgi:hypothetical protein
MAPPHPVLMSYLIARLIHIDSHGPQACEGWRHSVRWLSQSVCLCFSLSLSFYVCVLSLPPSKAALS